MSARPTLKEERGLIQEGYRLVAGVDEAGRGALAGPVVAAAVILPPESNGEGLGEIRDSKLLSAAKREALFNVIRDVALSTAVGEVPPQDIDALGIAQATRLAMRVAVEHLQPKPHSLLIDYLYLPDVPLPQKAITFGDRLCLSIACASIIAKVTRDRLMARLDGDYPGYGMRRHKGYGTHAHLSCISTLGPSPIHRRSFKPMREMINL